MFAADLSARDRPHGAGGDNPELPGAEIAPSTRERVECNRESLHHLQKRTAVATHQLGRGQDKDNSDGKIAQATTFCSRSRTPAFRRLRFPSSSPREHDRETRSRRHASYCSLRRRSTHKEQRKPKGVVHVRSEMSGKRTRLRRTMASDHGYIDGIPAFERTVTKQG